MKKFFSYLGWALLLAVIIAAFTTTGKEQCKKYVMDHLPPNSALNVTVYETPIRFLGVKLLGIYTVTYYKPVNLSLQQQAATGSPALAALKAASGMETENYVGIYNSFWKW
ncbi:MAG: hypothetical protein JST86_20575 [Bacteroidetes bacterium]|nr:hypothetical protein [Bacteroidota bacterium]